MSVEKQLGDTFIRKEQASLLQFLNTDLQQFNPKRSVSSSGATNAEKQNKYQNATSP